MQFKRVQYKSNFFKFVFRQSIIIIPSSKLYVQSICSERENIYQKEQSSRQIIFTGVYTLSLYILYIKPIVAHIHRYKERYRTIVSV